MRTRLRPLYEFGPFHLNAEERLLLKLGQPVPLTPKAFDTLLLLVENNGRLIDKDELMGSVWPDAVVEENNLNRSIYVLRKALGETAGTTKYIETVPKHGYRFVASVVEVETEEAHLIVERHTSARIITEDEISTTWNGAPNQIVKTGRKSLTRIAATMPRIVIVSLIAITAGLVLWVALGGRSTNPPETNSLRALVPKEPGFGVDGKVLTDFGFKIEKGQAIALQPDGKVVAGGWAGESQVTSDFALARYNPDGSLDTSFHGDGKVVTSLSERSDIMYGLTVQPDGRIVAAGVTFNGPKTRRFAVVRYKVDGALDASFNGDGIVTLNVGTGLMDTAYGVAVQPDGKILVAGSALMVVVSGKSRVSQNDFALVRLNADGSLDTSFGDDGKVTTDFGFGVDIAYALALQSDGRIVVAGVATNGTDQDFALARYENDGKLDASFGNAGKVRTDFFDEDDLIWALAIQSNGKIVAGGYAAKAAAIDFALARYTDDGSLDNSFDGNGKVTIDVNGNDNARAVGLQRDGKIVVGVYSNNGVAPEFACARLLEGGKPDETFGSFGKARIPFKTQAEAFGMALLPGGDAIMVGSAGSAQSSHFALARVGL